MTPSNVTLKPYPQPTHTKRKRTVLDNIIGPIIQNHMYNYPLLLPLAIYAKM